MIILYYIILILNILLHCIELQISDKKLPLTNTQNNTIGQDNKSNKEDVIRPLKDSNSEVRAGISYIVSSKELKTNNNKRLITSIF